MGQKINPIGYRLGVTKNWSSKWYANSKNFSVFLQNDIKVREFLNKKLANAAVSKIVIERPAKNAKITIYSARPGIVIGKKGEDIETLRSSLQNLMGIPVQLNIEEIRKPEVDASLIAQSIAQQLEKRVMFRRAMKRAMQNAMRLGAQGIKIMSSGRLNGIEIARSEWYREGRVPLHTLRADIDYGVARAQTTYGIIGIKVWIFKGERFEEPTNVNKDNIEQNDEIKDAPVKKTIKEAVASKIKKASEEPKTAVKAPAKAKVEAKPKAPAKAKVEAKPKAPAKAKVEKKSTKKQDKVLVEKSSNDNDKDEA
jgi:small subunit ribosomal protein S3